MTFCVTHTVSLVMNLSMAGSEVHQASVISGFDVSRCK